MTSKEPRRKQCPEPTNGFGSNLINLVSKTYFKNFQRIQDRSFKIISGKAKLSNSKQKVSHLVFTCLNKMAPEILCSKFEKIKHGISTRSNGMMLRLPQVKSENGGKCFSF